MSQNPGRGPGPAFQELRARLRHLRRCQAGGREGPPQRIRDPAGELRGRFVRARARRMRQEAHAVAAGPRLDDHVPHRRPAKGQGVQHQGRQAGVLVRLAGSPAGAREQHPHLSLARLHTSALLQKMLRAFVLRRGQRRRQVSAPHPPHVTEGAARRRAALAPAERPPSRNGRGFSWIGGSQHAIFHRPPIRLRVLKRALRLLPQQQRDVSHVGGADVGILAVDPRVQPQASAPRSGGRHDALEVPARIQGLKAGREHRGALPQGPGRGQCLGRVGHAQGKRESLSAGIEGGRASGVGAGPGIVRWALIRPLWSARQRVRRRVENRAGAEHGECNALV